MVYLCCPLSSDMGPVLISKTLLSWNWNACITRTIYANVHELFEGSIRIFLDRVAFILGNKVIMPLFYLQ